MAGSGRLAFSGQGGLGRASRGGGFLAAPQLALSAFFHQQILPNGA